MKGKGVPLRFSQIINPDIVCSWEFHSYVRSSYVIHKRFVYGKNRIASDAIRKVYCTFE